MGKRRKKNTEDDDFKFFDKENRWYEHIGDVLAIVVAAGIGLFFFFVWIVWPFISLGLATGGGFLAGILRSFL